jgi:hypothetical protein
LIRLVIEVDNVVLGDPIELLRSLVEREIAWSIDFSKGTSDERFQWGRADFSARVLRALCHGRSVFFQGSEYVVDKLDELPRIAGLLEDAIVISNRFVVIEREDERGVWIGTGDPEVWTN